MEIHWVGLADIDEEQRTQVEERLERLARDHNDLIDVRITGHRSDHHRHGDQGVRIVCQARGRELIADKVCDEVGKALHDAMDVFEREVKRLREKRRDQQRGERPTA